MVVIQSTCCTLTCVAIDILNIDVKHTEKKMKISIASLGFITVTADAAGVEGVLVRAVSSLLQYDNNAVGDCDSIEALEADAAIQNLNTVGFSSTPCLVAKCLRLQILASIGYPCDSSFVEDAVQTDDSRYEPWELRHARAVLMFAASKDYARAVDMACSALEQEPRDVFSVRLLFIASLMSCRYGSLARCTQLCLQLFLGGVGVPQLGCSELIDALHAPLLQFVDGVHAKSSERMSPASPERDDVFGQFCAAELHTPQHLVASAWTLPFTMTYYAFALEEMYSDPRTGEGLFTSTGSELQLADAELWNDLSIRLVGALNDLRSSLAPSLPLRHPFAMHVVCHVYEARHDAAAGLRAVQAVPAEFWKPVLHLSVHCWWHVALFHLDLGEYREALDIFDAHIAPRVIREDPFGISDGTAFLTRALISGAVQSGDARFQHMNELWRHHTDRGDEVLCVLERCPFFYVHAILSEWACGSPLPRVVSSCSHTRANFVVCTLLRDVLERQDLTSLQRLWSARSGNVWHGMGGSAAQRDLLMRLAFYALLSFNDSSMDAALRHEMRAWLEEFTALAPSHKFYARVQQLLSA